MIRVLFIPHRFSIMGYFRFFFKRKVNYMLIFLLSLLIILGLIYIYGTSVWYDPGGWWNDLQQLDFLSVVLDSLETFIRNIYNFFPYIIAFYSTTAIGYLISRIIVSFLFYIVRKTKKNLYYVIRPMNKPLPEGYGYKLPPSNFMYVVYLAVILSFLVNFIIFPFIELGSYQEFIGIVLIGTSTVFSLIDYSHILILSDNRQEVVYSSKTFGKSFLKPIGPFKAHTTKFESGRKGYTKRSQGIGSSRCPKCKFHLYGYGVVECPNCKMNLRNIICPICRDGFSKVDEKAYCPKCLLMYHHTHLLNYVSIFKKCPSCKEVISYDDIENYREISIL
ncbi:MAG: RING finger protein [Candidatus Hodarchaeales archaeon]